MPGLRSSTVSPSRHVVVAIGDNRIREIVAEMHSPATCADLIVFLDVGCIPGRHLLARYAAAAWESDHRGSLL